MTRAVAVAEWLGPEAGLAILQVTTLPAWLGGYYFWDAVLGELDRGAQHHDASRHHLERALAVACSTGSDSSPIRVGTGPGLP